MALHNSMSKAMAAKARAAPYRVRDGAPGCCTSCNPWTAETLLYERLAFYQWIDLDQGNIIVSTPQKGITAQDMNGAVSGFLKTHLPLVPDFYLNFIDTYFDGDIPDSIVARLANFPNQLCCTALLDHISRHPDTPLVLAPGPKRGQPLN